MGFSFYFCAQAEEAPPVVSKESEAAFHSVVSNAFPLSPEQILQFKAVAAKQAEANAALPGKVPALGTSNILLVTMKPGALMPVVRVGQGMITSLVFLDASGGTWPVSSYVIGDPKSISVNWDKKGGVVMLQGQTLYAQTNLGVILQGLSVPVMLDLVVGQKEWDYLDYVRVSESLLGSDGQVQAVSSAPAYLNSLLMGIPPSGARPMQSSSTDAQVWAYGEKYLLLTRGILLSPAWVSHVSSGGQDAYNAYILPVAPVLMLSTLGRVQSVKVTGPSNND